MPHFSWHFPPVFFIAASNFFRSLLLLRNIQFSLRRDIGICHIGTVDFDYRGEGSVKAWLHRIVVNDSLKYLRANGKMKYVDDLPDVEDDVMDSLPDVPVAVVAEMIKALPDGYRTVFNLFVFEKKSHREIAELLGIKEDSSASQFFRARAMLAKKIKEYVREHE